MTDNLCGQKIGKLLIVEKIQRTKHKNRCSYLCRCDCGTEKIIGASRLTNRAVMSCGCSFFTDIVGSTFGNWIVIARIPNEPNIKKQEIKWKCKCKCGKISSVLGKCLKNGTSKSCGCLIDERGPDLTGRIFGYLTVLGKTKEKILPSPNAKWRRRAWNCLCVCGNEKIITENDLLFNNDTSCGCMQLSKNIEAIQKMNQKKRKYSPEFSSARNVYRGRYDDGDITFSDFVKLAQQNCFYCGAEPSNHTNRAFSDRYASQIAKKTGTFIYNGLDRLDSSGRHTLDNVVTCCKTCNYAKRRMSVSEFYDWIKKVYNKIPKE